MLAYLPCSAPRAGHALPKSATLLPLRAAASQHQSTRLLCIDNTSLPCTCPQVCLWPDRTTTQAQTAALRRVGQGGLGETAGEGAAPEQSGLEQGRRGEVVAGSDLLRQPCQADTAMRVLAQQLRQVKHASAGAPAARSPCCCHG